MLKLVGYCRADHEKILKEYGQTNLMSEPYGIYSKPVYEEVEIDEAKLNELAVTCGFTIQDIYKLLKLVDAIKEMK